MSIHRIAVLFLFFLAAGITSGKDAETVAFPGAEGYGRFTQGGRGGDVYIVTNLNDAGKGSLRNGVEDFSGPRTIVFAISGTIELNSKLEIRNSNLTIAGQTAPGDGICIKHYGLDIRHVNDIIIRYIRVRMGDQNKGTSSGDDCLTIQDSSNIIIDHLSSGWGIDAVQDTRRIGSFTLQWSIYGETLHDTIHYEGAPHSKLGSFRECTGNVSIHHNLLHSSHDRHPSLGGGETTPKNTIIDFRNNLIYNADGQTNLGNAQLSVINNYYKQGPDTDTGNLPMRIKGQAGKGPDPTGFASGNIFPWNSAWTNDNFSAIKYVQSAGGKYMDSSREEWGLPGELVFGADKPLTQSPSEASDLILLNAGASKSRDVCDIRIINEVKTGTGQIPDSQDQVGGWPTLKSLPAPMDADKDGMADAWEKANGLNPKDAEDRNGDRDSDGFTNLEEYINSLTRC
ncbi:MAG: pectate lyase [Fuerstiella sp.]|nr:pectate lyase [Fuerstiella sp.]MCP4852885.1 pectate lyase [Fuerstiella sp.]